MHDPSVLFVQAFVGFLVIFVMAASALTQNSEYVPPLGILQIVVLATFVKRHLGNVHGLEWLTTNRSADEEGLPAAVSGRTRRLVECYAQFHERGMVAESELLPWTLKHEPLAHWVGTTMVGATALILAPVVGLFSVVMSEKEAGVSTTSLVSPVERAYRLIQVVGLLAAVCLWSAIIVYLSSGLIRISFLAGLAIPFLCLAISVVRITVAQRRWKAFWSAKLAEVVQHATAQDDHDLFLRASYFADSVKRESVIPLTDAQRAVLAVTAVVQLILLEVIPLVKALWQHHLFVTP